MKGIVKFFNEAKGFGFIIDGETQGEFFFHVSNVLAPVTLKTDDKVSFSLVDGRKGKQAANVLLEAVQ